MADKQAPLVQLLKQHCELDVQDVARSRQPSQYPLEQVSPPQHGRVALQLRPRHGAQVPPPTRESHVCEQQLPKFALVHAVPSGLQHGLPARSQMAGEVQPHVPPQPFASPQVRPEHVGTQGGSGGEDGGDAGEDTDGFRFL